jgi:hypothetical protein
MQYMLLIYEDENALRSPQVMQEVVAAHMRLAAELREKGFLVAGDGLQTSDTATTVRHGAAGHTLHDGPYPETREQLGGYYLIDVADLDAALVWAKQVPVAAGGGVEIRPLMTY